MYVLQTQFIFLLLLFFSLLQLAHVYSSWIHTLHADDCIDSDIHEPQQVKEYAIDFFSPLLFQNRNALSTDIRLVFHSDQLFDEQRVGFCVVELCFQHHFMFLQYYHRNCVINAKQMRSKFYVYTAAMSDGDDGGCRATIDSMKSLMLGILSSKCVAN